MNDNTILRIKVPAHLYESVKQQLTLTEASKAKKQFGAEFTVVKEKKMSVPKDGMKKMEEAPKAEEAKVEETWGSKEEGVNEAIDPNLLAGIFGFLMGGGPIVATLLKQYKDAKTPEEKKDVLKKASAAIGSKMSGNMEEKKEVKDEEKIEEKKEEEEGEE